MSLPATRSAVRVETLVGHIVAVIDGRKQDHDTSSAQFGSSFIMHRDLRGGKEGLLLRSLGAVG